MTQQAASKSVAELETLGYVERSTDEADARIRRVRLSERGREVVAFTRRPPRDHAPLRHGSSTAAECTFAAPLGLRVTNPLPQLGELKLTVVITGVPDPVAVLENPKRTARRMLPLLQPSAAGAATPLNVTVLVPCVAPKRKPASVTAVPAAAELGTIMLMLSTRPMASALGQAQWHRQS